MRINKFIAGASALSRRAADEAISAGRVKLNGQAAEPGSDVRAGDNVTLDGIKLVAEEKQTILFNKPTGYVCSRDGQGSKTIYDLLPDEYQNLNSIGRLDKESSGLLLLTNDGKLAQELSHPSKQKNKIYQIELDQALSQPDVNTISKTGVELEDGLSKFILEGKGRNWTATLHEGRNRQIRRTFEKLGYKVIKLHRTHFGDYSINDLKIGSMRVA